MHPPSIRAAALLTMVSACGSPSQPAGSRLQVDVSALSLEGVSDVAYTISVANAQGIVWSEPGLRASKFGDGNSLTYIGPCDASANPHTVSVTIDALYDGTTPIDPSTYRNPTPVEVPATCVANSDVPVDINLTIARSANQGFFDVAVTFDQIFCSAKIDCAGPALLFDPATSARVPTAVLGFACAGGASTHLWLDELVLTCGGDSVPLDVFGPFGNQHDLASPAPDPLVQVATYSAASHPMPADLDVLYFNVALGFDPDALVPALDCSLTTAATASRAPFATPFTTPTNTAWPLIRWQVDLTNGSTPGLSCGSQALDASAGVTTQYTGMTPHAFAYHVLRDGTGSGTRIERRSTNPDDPGQAEVLLFADALGDGVYDDGLDLGFEGVEVTFSGNGTYHVTTDATGRARITLPAGTWQVDVADGQDPLDAFATAALPRTLSIVAGGTSSVAIAFVEAAEVRGKIFDGTAFDLLYDGDETLRPGVTVTLSRSGQTLSASANGQGTYRFVVPFGTWTLTLGAGQGVDAPELPRTLTLAPGEFVNADIGVVP